MHAWASPSDWATTRQRSISKFFMSSRKPSPSLPRRMSSVSTTSSKNTSTNGMICWPIFSSGAVDRPGVSVGMSHSDMLSLAWAGCSSLDTTSM